MIHQYDICLNKFYYCRIIISIIKPSSLIYLYFHLLATSSFTFLHHFVSLLLRISFFPLPSFLSSSQKPLLYKERTLKTSGTFCPNAKRTFNEERRRAGRGGGEGGGGGSHGNSARREGFRGVKGPQVSCLLSSRVATTPAGCYRFSLLFIAV